MPMVTDLRLPRYALTRRGLLQVATAVLAGPALAHPTGGVALAAAWEDAEGHPYIGMLTFAISAHGAPARLVVRHALPVPTRAHAVVPLPDGSLVAVARRPGAWLLRWHPARPPASARWRWSEADRSFNGHAQPFGLHGLVTTETDAADGASLLVHRDARTLDVLDEWPTGGIDAHAVLPLPEGGWLVANGGVPTLPESGRVKRDLAAMDASLARLDSKGTLQVQWRLADRRLSLRHLARHAGGAVGVALQAEHDDPLARQRAPLLALWDGQRLRVGEAVGLAGYAGDIVAQPEGFALAATRAGCVVRHDLAGRLVAQHPLAAACALAPWPSHGWLASGAGAVAMGTGDEATVSSVAGGPGRVDNHWAIVT